MITHSFLNLTEVMRSAYQKMPHGSELELAHRKLIDQVMKSFRNTQDYKSTVMHVFNYITYLFVEGNSYLNDDFEDPMSLPSKYGDIDDKIIQSAIGSKFIQKRSVDWSQLVSVEFKSNESVAEKQSPLVIKSKQPPDPKNQPIRQVIVSSNTGPIITPTSKSDLYIQSPTVPQFDTSKPWASGYIDGILYTIYPSLPKIPTKQNEISATTEESIIGDAELRGLYPNVLIRTRAACMYDQVPGIKLNSVLGLILPIEGYTEEQLIDNLVKYPHLFKLMKEVDGTLKSFYSTVEINGELKKVSDIWYTLPESKVIPYTKDFVKEYVVRRYLLERDVKGIEHRYKLYGTLDPYLTLFAPIENYLNLGYTDIVGIARACVRSRVNYKRSRNPVLRRLANE